MATTRSYRSVAFTLCTTGADVLSAIEVLSQHTYVILDCEGRQLGLTTGALSLLCMGSPIVAGTPQSIFVIDVPAILTDSPAAIALATFLASKATVKVVWDGRMDAIELQQSFSVALGRVLDLQIAEVLARETISRESGTKRLDRLARSGFGFRAVKQDRKMFEGLDVVMGMQQCIEDFKLDFGVSKDTEVVQMHRRGESARWMDRPLPSKLLQYAANDIAIIAHVLSHFCQKSLVPAASHPTFSALVDKSDRYVYRCGKQGRIESDDPCSPKGLLAIGALQPPVNPLERCTGCRIHLPLSCFGSTGKGQKGRCQLCKALILKERLISRRHGKK